MEILSKHEVEIEGKLSWQHYHDLVKEYNRQHWRIEQWQKDYEHLQSRLAAAEAELEEIKSCYVEDMKYVGGIVEKGTGKELIGDIPIRLQLLGYVKSIEISNLRRCHTEAQLLEVIKLFYRKHVLNDESIGWDELGDKLYNELSEILGDKEFCKWLDTQSM